MFRKLTIALALALSTASLSTVALAETGREARAGARAEKGGKHDKKFPMEAAAFKKHVETRIAHVKERVEKHITEKKVSDEKAKEIREKLAKGIAKVNAEVEKATADGTVTKDEAKTVHHAMKEMHPHKKHEKKADALRRPTTKATETALLRPRGAVALLWGRTRVERRRSRGDPSANS